MSNTIRGGAPESSPLATAGRPAADKAPSTYSDANWAKLDQLKPDSNKPVMPSQREYLEGAAKKLGKDVGAITREELFYIASNAGSPGPSELQRIQGAIAPAGWKPAGGAGSAPRPQVAAPPPKTLADMNQAAGMKLDRSRARLEGLEQGLSASQADIGGKGLVKREAAAFRAYAEAAAEFAGSAFKGGSLEPHTRASTLGGLMDQRSAMLEARNTEGVVAYGTSAGGGLSNQADMNQDAGITLNAARAELAALTQQVGLRLQGSPRAAALEQSSARFGEYVSAAADRAAAQFSGGSMAPMARAGVEEALLRERTALLKTELARLDL